MGCICSKHDQANDQQPRKSTNQQKKIVNDSPVELVPFSPRLGQPNALSTNRRTPRSPHAPEELGSVSFELFDKNDKLKKIEKNQLKDFTFEGIITQAKVVSVYDGDTCRVAFYYPLDSDEIIMFSGRLAGIDTPEIRTKNFKEKELAIKAKNRLIELVTENEKSNEKGNNKLIYIKCMKNDKYGRPMIFLFQEEQENDSGYTLENSINDILVKEKLAKYYNGGRKEPWFVKK